MEEKKEYEERVISPKEDRIRKMAILYYLRPDIRKAMYEFSKHRECVPRYFEGFGKRPDSFQYDSDILELAKKGATSFHCSEELWSDPLELSTGQGHDEVSKLRTGWDLIIDIDCKYIEYSKKAASALLQALSRNGVNNVGIKFSVTGDTPILIKQGVNISLKPIKEAIEIFKKTKNLEVLSLDKKKNLKFSRIYDSLEHDDKIYDITHENSKIPVKATAHHSVFIFDKGNIIQKKVSELKKGDFLVTFNAKNNPVEDKISSVKNIFKFSKNQFIKDVFHRDIPIDKDLMRLLGYYLAEGHVTNTINQVGFSFNKNEEFYISDCTSILEKLTGKIASIRHPNPNSTQILIHSKEWATFFEDVCGKSKNKHLPPFIWNLEKELFLEILKGYLRGDAHKTGEYTLTAKSVVPQMIREFVWLCKLNGISCSLSTEYNKAHKLPQGTMFKGSFVYILSIPKSEIVIEEFNRSRNKFSPFPRDKTFPVNGLKEVYGQIKPKKFLSHRVEQVTLRKKRANLERIKKVINWFKNFKSIDFNAESLEIIKNYESLFNSEIGVVQIKNILEKGIEKVYDVSVDETESFFGNDYPVLLHNSGGKGFHLIVPWKAFPEELSGKRTSEMFPEWPRLICQYLKEQSREFLEKDLYSSEDSSVLSKLKKGIRCERCKNMSEKAELILFLCPSCKTRMENLTPAFKKKRIIRCPNCQIEMKEQEKFSVYKCSTCVLDSRKNPENFNEGFEHVDVFEVLGLDVILVSPRHLFRMPYSLHEKTSLASIVIPKEKLLTFDMIKDADPFKVKPVDFIPDCKSAEALNLLRNAIEFKPAQKQDDRFTKSKEIETITNKEGKQESLDSSISQEKKFKDFTLTNITPDLYPPSISKILEGMKSDGRKRALFILLSFFRSLKFSEEEITKQVTEWNKKNYEPIREAYISAQISWYTKQKESKMPPNFDKPYYKEIGITPTSEEIAMKNPVSWTIKKGLSRNYYKNKNKK